MLIQVCGGILGRRECRRSRQIITRLTMPQWSSVDTGKAKVHFFWHGKEGNMTGRGEFTLTGLRMPWKKLGMSRGSTQFSCSTCLASCSPAMSSHLTPKLASSTSLQNQSKIWQWTLQGAQQGTLPGTTVQRVGHQVQNSQQSAGRTAMGVKYLVTGRPMAKRCWEMGGPSVQAQQPAELSAEVGNAPIICFLNVRRAHEERRDKVGP